MRFTLWEIKIGAITIPIIEEKGKTKGESYYNVLKYLSGTLKYESFEVVIPR